MLIFDLKYIHVDIHTYNISYTFTYQHIYSHLEESGEAVGLLALIWKLLAREALYDKSEPQLMSEMSKMAATNQFN